MNTVEIVGELDAEIARLQQVRELLAGVEQSAKRGPGRPKGSAGKAVADVVATVVKRRVLSPEARERIAAAQRARWAAHSAASGKDAEGEAKPATKRGRPAKKAGGTKRRAVVTAEAEPAV